MHPRITLSILACLIVAAAFGQPSRFLFGKGKDPAIQQHLEEVNKKNADTTFLYSAIPQYPVNFREKNNAVQHFPYPIIFIHGLVGSADSWTAFYTFALDQGWSYGGELLFNLNADENFSYSNIYAASQSDVIDFNEGIAAGDFYLVNFNCSIDGTPYGSNYNTTTQSNQAAIVKQGLAIRQSVGHVLEATGKDKVILFGHSMGGLAAREYLQNLDLWQDDGNHHIAKLITSGTPHGGSNLAGPGFSNLVLGIDEGSDAVRDLRRSYFYSGDPGVFLYGGKESPAVMNDRLLGFQDYDVNCNGTEGDQITGLNQKDLSIDLDFTCVVGDYSGDIFGGDLVVGLEEAQLKSYYDILSETFTIGALHTRLPDQTNTNYEAFDEPDFYDLSYQIDVNTDYAGFITAQAPDAEYQEIDFDDFVFTTPEMGWVSVFVDNLAAYPFGISILGDPGYNYIFDQTFQDEPILTDPIPLPAGTYYLEFYAKGNSTSWQYPYNFKLEWSPNLPTATGEPEAHIKIHSRPNPVSQFVSLTIETEDYLRGTLKLHNELGQVLHQQAVEGIRINERIYMGELPDGMYFLTVMAADVLETVRIVKRG